MEALYFLACIASLWQGVTSFVPETAPTAKIAEPGTAKCRHWRVEFSPRFLDTYARLITFYAIRLPLQRQGGSGIASRFGGIILGC